MRTTLRYLTVLLALLAAPSLALGHDGPVTVSAGRAHLWLGLASHDDIGTRFDVRTELYVSETLVAEGETLANDILRMRDVRREEIQERHNDAEHAGEPATSSQQTSWGPLATVQRQVS